MSDSVALLLKELRLPAFGRHYHSLWETAVEKSWSHTDYLAALCDQLFLLPNDNYRQLWQLADQQLEARDACKWIVTVLRLAYEYDDEQALGRNLLASAKAGQFASITELQARYLTRSQAALKPTSPQHELVSYDELLSSMTGASQQPDQAQEALL